MPKQNCSTGWIRKIVKRMILLHCDVFWSCFDHFYIQDSGDGENGLLLAMKWASPGAWEAWEGRAYMYLDVALSKTIEGEAELYGGETWDAVCQALKNLPEQEYAERVCMDWMERRKELGETMDENGKILLSFLPLGSHGIMTVLRKSTRSYDDTMEQRG